MTIVHCNGFQRHLKSFPALVAALILTIICGAVGQSFPSAAQAETFSDSGFTAEVVTTLPPFLPVGVTWASDGRMFIWQRNGVIRIYKNGQLLAMPFLDISANVNVFDDRGMLGLALHPNFLMNGYVYVIYVHEDGGDPNNSSPKIARLSRFTTDPQNPDVALSTSETILLTIPNETDQHLHGTLRFGADGKLFMGHGDDASSSFADVRAFVAQDLNDLRGKILRINEDGTAPGDNPFDDGTNSIKSKVYSYGLRNPFRFTLHPVSGEPYFGDVGWNSWEELGRGRGKNFGWPCYEGMNPQPQYQSAFPAQCAPLTPSVVTAPILAYPLPGTPPAASAPIVGNTALGGPFYTATLYPEVYRGNWFTMDYGGGWITRMVFDGSGNPTSTVPFATGLSGPVDLELGPDGMLYYVSIVTGQVKRIRYNGPSAVAAATPASGHSPLSVNFSSAGSSDPNGSPLTYLWDFGDGQTSTAANPFHVYASGTVQTFTVKLTVTNNTSQSASATVKVTVGSLPPTAIIQSPINGTNVIPGQTITYQGSASDPEDGVIPSAGLSWIILLHHNDHTHTQLFTTGPTGSVVIQNHGIGTYSYEFQLTATDSSGLTHTTSVILPVINDTTPPSNPTALVATVPSANQINLGWTASTDPGGGAVTYRVERCQSIGCTSFEQITASVATAAYSDTGLLPGTTYSYRVRATDAMGNLSLNYSNVVSATTSANPLEPVAAYAFDAGAGTTTADASGNGLTGTLAGATWTSVGKYGNALAFDGATDYVDLGNPTPLQLTGSMTWSAWVFATANPRDDGQIIAKSAASDGWQLKTSPDTGSHTFGVAVSPNGSSLVQRYSTTIRALNTWYHVAGVYNATARTLDIYVNGVLDNGVLNGTVPAAQFNSPQTVNIGRRTGGYYFQGTIDNVRIYNRALSANEVTTDMNTPATAGQVAAYAFDAGAGTTTADASGNGLTGTLAGATWTSVGKYGNALAFDGATDYVDLGNPTPLQLTGSMTWSAWVFATANPRDDGQIIAKSAASDGWQLKTSPDTGSHTFGVAVSPNGSSLVQRYSTTIRALNTWYHVAGVYNATARTLDIYVNGVLDNGVLNGTVPAAQFNSPQTVNIGRRTGGYYFQGTIDNVRIYNRALSANEVTTDMNTPVGPQGPDTTPPTTPGAPTTTAVSATQINLSWTAATDNVGVTGYRVERCQGAGCTTFVQIAAPVGTTFGDTGLIASTVYSYRVKAVDAASNVSVNYSPVASATTQAPPDTIPPTNPTGLTATSVSSSQIDLAWTAATDSGGSGLAGYRVERCQGVGCTTFVQIATPVPNSYSDPGLTAGTSYSYRVRAADGAGNLSVNYSNTASATPQAPNLVTAYGLNEGSGTTLADVSGSGHTGTLVNGPAWVASQATYGQALSFDGVDDAVSVANPSTLNFGTSDFTIELWAKRTLLGGQQRHLFSKCGNATWSTGCKEFYFKANNTLAFGSFATGDTLSIPIADTNWHHIAVTFVDATNTLRFYVDGALVTTATNALEADGAGHVVTFGNHRGSNPFSGLLDEVRLYGRALTQSEIQTDMATPISPPDLTPPSNVPGLTATAVSATQINLSWTAATDNVGVTGYRVERCQGAGCTTFVQIAAPADTTFGDTGLLTATPYSYRVKAVDAATNVSVNYSPVASATTQVPPDTIPPTNPTGLTATAVSSSQIDLAWTAATDSGGSGLAGYRVERCQGASCTTFVQIASPVTNSYPDPGLTAGTSYSYRVRAADGAGNLSVNYSNTASATPPLVLNLVTAYGLNEGSGTTLADASGSGHTGTLVNGPAWVAGQATYGQALSFDGVDDAVSVANPSTLNVGTSDFTIELWAKRTLLGGQQRHLFSKCGNATWSTGCKEFYFKANNTLAFGSFATGDTLSIPIADTTWHHIAVTFVDATNTLRFYVDGTLRTTATKALEADGASHLVTFGNHLLGGPQGINAFSGLLDEVRLYGRALTQGEIQTDMTTPIAP